MDHYRVKASRCSEIRWEKHLCTEYETCLSRTIKQTYRRSAGQLSIVYHRKKKHWNFFHGPRWSRKPRRNQTEGAPATRAAIKVVPAQQRSGDSGQTDRARLLDTLLLCPVSGSGCPLLCFQFNYHQFWGGGREPWVPAEGSPDEGEGGVRRKKG